MKPYQGLTVRHGSIIRENDNGLLRTREKREIDGLARRWFIGNRDMFRENVEIRRLVLILYRGLESSGVFDRTHQNQMFSDEKKNNRLLVSEKINFFKKVLFIYSSSSGSLTTEARAYSFHPVYVLNLPMGPYFFTQYSVSVFFSAL
jgi:hypothetical protein